MAILNRDPDLAPADDADEVQRNHAMRLAEFQSIDDDIYGITRGKTPCGVNFFIDADDCVTFESRIKLIDIIAFAKAVTTKLELPGVYRSASPEVRKYLQLKIAGYPFEVFGALFFDCSDKFIKMQKFNFGTDSNVRVPIRMIVKTAIELDASSAIFFHNHPQSQQSCASQKDIEVTKQLRLALHGINVYTIDHVIVTLHDTFSMNENGLFKITASDIPE